MRVRRLVAEEVRFFLRIALYAAVIAIVYWFASRAYEGLPLEYDWAGTTLLAFTALACAAVTSIVLLFARAARRDLAAREGSWPRRLGATANRLIGLEHRSAGDTEGPLTGGPDVLPAASPWPIVTALAATLVLLGLIFGPWLIAPGAVLLVIGAGGWLRQQ
jgi:hypothetical protein